MSNARLKSGAVKFWEEMIKGAPRFSPYRWRGDEKPALKKNIEDENDNEYEI